MVTAVAAVVDGVLAARDHHARIEHSGEQAGIREEQDRRRIDNDPVELVAHVRQEPCRAVGDQQRNRIRIGLPAVMTDNVGDSV